MRTRLQPRWPQAVHARYADPWSAVPNSARAGQLGMIKSSTSCIHHRRRGLAPAHRLLSTLVRRRSDTVCDVASHRPSRGPHASSQFSSQLPLFATVPPRPRTPPFRRKWTPADVGKQALADLESG